MPDVAYDSVSTNRSTVVEIEGVWTDRGPHPIRRWVARLFDYWATTGLVFVMAGAPLVAADRKLELVALPVGFLVMAYLVSPIRGLATAALNAFLLSYFSATPGKWLCGVRIVRKDGAPLSFGLAFRRELVALTFGCGLYIPLISLATSFYGFNELRDKGATSWDQRYGLVVVQRPNGYSQALLVVVALVPAVIMVLFTLMLMARLGGR